MDGLVSFSAYYHGGGAQAVLCAVPSNSPNVILLVLNQLKPDGLHCYGNHLATRPNIACLARSSSDNLA